MDPDLEKKLKELEKKSKYAPLREVSQKIRQGVYEENAKQLEKNRANLTQKVKKWKKKIEKGDEKEKSIYDGKFEFAKGLLELLSGTKKPEIQKVLGSEKEKGKEKEKTVVKKNSEKEEISEQEFAMKKKIGEAALAPAEVDPRLKLTEIASLAPELTTEIGAEVKQTKEYKNAYEAKTLNFKKGNFTLTDSKDPMQLQAFANAARAFLVEQDKSELFPVVTKETLNTGDCFYSAIYRSAKERGYLEELTECLGLDISNENDFIQSLRNIIADEIYNDRLPGTQTQEGYLDTYDFLVHNYAENKKSYALVIQGFPTWFRKQFKDGPGDKKKFLEALVAHVMTMTEWVGQIEVEIAQKLFKTHCGIEIHVHNHKRKDLPKIYKGSPVFHLYNQGESHYVFFSFKIPISQLKKAPTAKKAEVETKDDPCGAILYDPCTGFPITEGEPLLVVINRLKELSAKMKKGGTRKRR